MSDEPVPPDRPVVDFDHLGATFAADPAASFLELRETCPVAWSPHHGGFWIPTRYEDIASVSRDDTTFSSARHPADSALTAITIPQMPSLRSNPIELDPPEFFAYRRILNPLLSPAAVERELVPLVERLTTFFVDRFINEGRCDLIHDFASPVPAAFTLAWLGIPLEHWRRFSDIQHAIVSLVAGTPEHGAAVEGLFWSYEIINQTIAERRREPRHDVISHLLAQEIDGVPLSNETVADMVRLLIAGGVDTTTSLTGQALLYLYQHPEERRHLRNDPELLPAATEEFLRVFCPVTTLGRTVVREARLGDQALAPGERVMLPWYAANRDPAAFPDPDAVRLDRHPNRHTAFGLGIHRCVGSNLARRSFQTMITAVLDRFPDYKIDTSRAHAYPAFGINSGWSDLPATFPPGGSSGQPPPFPEVANHAGDANGSAYGAPPR
jgi:cytochrome P450